MDDGTTADRRRAFGRRVASLRREKGLSQEALALDAGLDRSYMGRVERRETSVSFDKIWGIADALGVRPGELFESDAR